MNVLKTYLKSSFKKFAPYFALSLLCFALYLPGIASIPMDDRDSAHFAQATRQMLETGNYFQIRYQDITRYQKPPGINWLQALSVKLLSSPKSNTVWPYRLPSVISAWLSVLLTFAFAKHFIGGSGAGIAACLLACAILLNVEAHMAVIDTSLLSSVILMQGALWMVYDKTRQNKPVHWGWALLFFISMAYGILLKGVTLLVGFLTLMTLSYIDRTTRYFKAIHLFWGIILLLLISAGWLIGVSYAEHTNYLMQMLNHDLLPKLAGGHESHGGYFGTHLFLLLITFWPASLFLWPMAVRTWKQRREPIEKFLIAWILPTWLFFEIMPTKLPQYILPVFPALAILTAMMISTFNHRYNTYPKIMRFLISLWVIVSCVLAIGVISIPYLLYMPFSSTAMKMGIASMSLLVITSIIAARWVFQGTPLSNDNKTEKRENLHEKAHTGSPYFYAFLTLVIGSVLSFSIAYHSFLPALTPVWTSQQVAETMVSYPTDDQHPLCVIGYGEPSLVFVQGTHRVQFDSIATLLNTLDEQRNHDDYTIRYILVDQRFNDDFVQAMQTHNNTYNITLSALKTFSTFNYNKGHWIDLTLYSVTL